jgi:Flp pilus assembly protein TadD
VTGRAAGAANREADVGRSCKVGVALIVVVAVCGVPATATAQSDHTAELRGLHAFLEARTLESEGRLREAIDAYGEALRLAPERVEVRIRYASLMLDVGLADRALEVIGPANELDWYGTRVLGLALAQASARDPERLAEAESVLREALEVRDDDPNLRLAMAQVLDRAGKPAEAEAMIAALRRTYGGSAQLVAYHARLLRGLGRDAEALEAALACSQSPVPFPTCRELAVEILIDEGREGEAGERLLEWSDPDDLDAMLRAGALLARGGRSSQALVAVRRVLAVEPDSPRARMLEAMVLASSGRHTEAVDAYRRLLRADRDDVDLLLSLAWSAGAADDLETARDAMDRAWEVVSSDAGSPTAARVAVAAARTELAWGDVGRARDWLARVGDIASVGSAYVRLLGETYRRQERWDDGVGAMLRIAPQLEGDARRQAQALEAEMRLRGGDSRGLDRLRPLLDAPDVAGVALGIGVLQSVERWPAVEAETAAALERFPDERSLQFARAVALERMGRLEDSRAVFETMLEAEPDDATVANYLGYSLADRGVDLEYALELIERAVELDPDNSAYLDSLGWVHYRLGNLDVAERWLRRAVELGGTDGTILAHLGEVLAVRDARAARDEAVALLSRALEVGCEHPDRVRDLLEDLRAEP